MIYRECLEIVKVLLQSKEYISKLKFFTVPAYRISCFKNMQPEYEPDMKDIMGINFVLN